MRFIKLMLNKCSKSYWGTSTAYKTKYLGELDNMVNDESVKNVRVNRPALVLLTWSSSIVGLAPAALFLGRPHLLLYIAAGSTLSAILLVPLLLKSIKTSATYSPSFLEFLLGGLSAVYLPAAGGILSLVVYVVVYLVATLLEALIGRLGLQAQIVPGLVAYYPAAVLAVFLGIGSGARVDQLRRQLYPDVAGIKSAFYELVSQRQLVRYASVALLILSAVLVGSVATGSVGNWLYGFLQLYLFVVSAPLWLLEAETTRPREARDTVDDIGRLLRLAGYEVERFPTTGSADVDPLLIGLDLFAQRGEHRVVVDVRTTGESTEPVDWKAGAGLTMATWALSKHRDLSPEDVDRLLVLVDAKTDKSLGRFSKKEKVRIIRITSENVKRVLREGIGAEERQEAAGKLLGVPASPSRRGET